MILQALIEGGWNNAEEKEEETGFKSEELSDENTSDNCIARENTLDKGDAPVEPVKEDKENEPAKDEQEMVQSALNSQTVSIC